MSGLLLPEQIRHADHVVFNAKKRQLFDVSVADVSVSINDWLTAAS